MNRIACRANSLHDFASTDRGHAAFLKKHRHTAIDYMIPYNFLFKTFSFVIFTREFSSESHEDSSGTLETYSNGSKLLGKMLYGIFFSGSDKRLSYKLLENCSVLHAEVMTTSEAV